MYNQTLFQARGINMGITMNEIADMCGVSRGTVDRVLNKRGGVKSDTAQRILAAAESLGYTRKTLAASMPVSASVQYRIGLLINATGHPYFTDIMAGMLTALENLLSQNITGIVKMSHGFDVEQQLRQLDEMLQQNVDAVALTPANDPRIADKLREFTSRNIPVVIVSALLDNFDYFSFIGCNHYLSGRIAAGLVKQILSPGSKIAIMTSTRKMAGVSRRVTGFTDVLQAAKQNYQILPPVECFDDDAIAYKTVSSLSQKNHDIDLFFFAAGGYSGAYQALEDTGLLGKCKIIAFDTSEPNVFHLTHGNVAALLNQHPTEQGKQAIQQIADYLLKRSVPSSKETYMPVEILVDESFTNTV